MTFRADLLALKDRLMRRSRAFWLGAAGLTLGAGFIAASMTYSWFFSDLPKVPDAAALWVVNREPASTFIDRDGKVLAVRGPRYGEAVSLNALPAHVVQAFLAAEDKRFFEHSGVDQAAIARAAAANIGAGRTVQGGSTITQQLVKNLFLSPEQTIKRKLQEAMLSLRIEKQLTKDEILALYLNRIFLGQNSYGIDAAAHRYFSKHASDLTLPEAALLAALPKAPSQLDPTKSNENSRLRRNIVLDRMVEAGFITPQVAASAKTTPIVLVSPETYPDLGYAVDMAEARAREIVGPGVPDLVIELTIDRKLQEAAENAVKSTMSERGPDANASQAGFVALDSGNRIIAMVGGLSYAQSQFNRTRDAKRQPGSAFKTIVYAAAFEQGLRPAAVRVDRDTWIGNWHPENFGGDHIGPVTLTTAFAKSLNTVAAQIGQEIGPRAMVNMGERLGIRSPLEPNVSLSLGVSEVNLLELTGAYSVFRAEGVRREPYIIASIKDSKGKTLYTHVAASDAQVIEPRVAQDMTLLLQSVVTAGTGRRASLGEREVGGKTGTSQNFRDAWFIGFTADITAGAWVGNDDDSPMKRVTGGAIPAEIWKKFMEKAHEDAPLRPLPTGPRLELSPKDQALLALYEDLALAFARVGYTPSSELASVQR